MGNSATHLFLILLFTFANVEAADITQNSTHFISLSKYFNGIPDTLKSTLKFISLTNTQTTPEILLQALDGCTALETLELNSIKIVSAENEEFNSTVYLPNLQKFKLKTDWKPSYNSLAFFRKTNASNENVFNGDGDIEIEQTVGDQQISTDENSVLRINRDENEIVMLKLPAGFVDALLCHLNPNFKVKSLKVASLGNERLHCVEWSILEKFSFNISSLANLRVEEVIDEIAKKGKNMKELHVHFDQKFIEPSVVNLLGYLPITNVTCKNTYLDLNWIPSTLRTFESHNCTFDSDDGLDNFLKKTTNLEHLQLTNQENISSVGTVRQLHWAKLPATIRTVDLKNVDVIYDNNSTDLNNLVSIQIVFGRFEITNTFKLPVSLKKLLLEKVQVNLLEHLVENGISGSNLEILMLERILDPTGNKYSITIDLSKLNLPKVKEMHISDVNFVDSSSTHSKFKQLKYLTFTGDIKFTGPISAFKTAPIEKLFAYRGIEFINTNFKDVFGNNEFMEDINLGFTGDYVVDLAEFPTKMLKNIFTYDSKVIVKDGLKFDSLVELDFWNSSIDSVNNGICSMLANSKQLSEIGLHGFSSKNESLNLSTCFPTENLHILTLDGVSNIQISVGTVFPNLTILKVYNNLEKLDETFLSSFTSVFPALKNIKLFISNSTQSYALVYKLITESCLHDFEVKLDRVKPINTSDTDSVTDKEYLLVEKFLDENGVKRNETNVNVFRTSLPEICHLS